MIKLFKNTIFLMLLCATLAVSTATLAVRTTVLTAQVAAASASLATATISNRKKVLDAIARTKAKARIRRYVAAIPLIGIAAAGAFEAQDFLEWQQANPDGTKLDYSCEVAQASGEVIDDVLQSLPEKIRPSSDMVMSYLPTCER